jgi:hypothetical protein
MIQQAYMDMKMCVSRELHIHTGYEQFVNLKTYLGAFGGLGANPTHSMELE